MREIRFRAWDVEAKKMVHAPEPIHSWLGDFMTMDGRFYLPVKDASIPPPMVGWKYIDRILMQDTGLRDKNDRRIFEGDVVRVKWIIYPDDPVKREVQREATYQVIWSEISAAFMLALPEEEDPCGYGCRMFNSQSNEIEVLGNIYEHPELRKL